MLFYILYIFIFKTLLYFINIKDIYKLINLIFYNTNNNYFFFAILIGIFIKLLLLSIKTKYKFKDLINIIIFITIDVIKIIFINYSLFLLIAALFISVLICFFKLNNKYTKNVTIKILLFIIYIITPLTSIYISDTFIKNNKCNNLILFSSITVFIICNNFYHIFDMSLKTLIGSLIIFLLSFNIISEKIKKRNIILIFLLMIYLIYYSSFS